MARKFLTNQAAYSALDLSAYSLITLSFWGWWDAYSNNSGKTFFEFGDPNWAIAGGFIAYPDHSGGAFHIAMHNATIAWQDTFARSSAAAWHHYMLVYNRATPLNAAWVDGVAKTLTTIQHDAGSYGNFANTNLNWASRAHTSLFANCRMADVAIWGGVGLTTGHANGLTGGASPLQIRPGNLVYYVPAFGGDSPEPDYVLNGHATLVGATTINHPSRHPGLLVP